MIRVWRRHATSPEQIDAEGLVLAEAIVWIDLISPTPAEEKAVEAALAIEIPTREEMQAIELSSRLYRENGATYMTALLLRRKADEGGPAVTDPVTFVLTGERLVTIRYSEPKSFAMLEAQVTRRPEVCANGRRVFLGLIEAIVDRLADILEEAGAHVKSTASSIFRRSRGASFGPVVRRLGVHQSLNVQAHESLVSVSRVIGFAEISPQFTDSETALEELKLQQRDVQALIEHSAYMGDSVQFLLDAALGLIGIEQNETNKVFSIAAVMFLPPTLIAGIYGMNFEHMPELKWIHGYPFALGLMALSVAIGLVWIKRRGWI